VLSRARPEQSGTSGSLLIVEAAPDGAAQSQGLLLFNTDFAERPPGGVLTAAHLFLRSRRPSPGSVRLHRMLADWTPDGSWSSFGAGGLAADGLVAAASADAETGSIPAGFIAVDVTTSVRAWLETPGSNRGWALLADGGGQAAFDRAAGVTPPRLVLYYE
jgi:hypothetical protein